VAALAQRVDEMNSNRPSSHNNNESEAIATLQSDVSFIKTMMAQLLQAQTNANNTTTPPQQILVPIPPTNQNPHQAIPPTTTFATAAALPTQPDITTNNTSAQHFSSLTQQFPGLTRIPQTIINRATKMGHYGTPYSSVSQIGKAIHNLGATTTAPYRSTRPAQSNHTPPSPADSGPIPPGQRKPHRQRIKDDDEDSDHTPTHGHRSNDISMSQQNITTTQTTNYNTSPMDNNMQSPNVSIINSDIETSPIYLFNEDPIHTAMNIESNPTDENFIPPLPYCPDDSMSSGPSG
jgi:hypothetical protein